MRFFPLGLGRGSWEVELALTHSFVIVFLLDTFKISGKLFSAEVSLITSSREKTAFERN